MTDHNERLVASPAVGLDNILHQSAVPVIKAMKRLIKNQEIRILHESARKQHQALLTTRHLKERTFGKVFEAQHPHRESAHLVVGVMGTHIKPHAVNNATGHDSQACLIPMTGPMHLRRDIADMLFIAQMLSPLPLGHSKSSTSQA